MSHIKIFKSENSLNTSLASGGEVVGVGAGGKGKGSKAGREKNVSMQWVALTDNQPGVVERVPHQVCHFTAVLNGRQLICRVPQASRLAQLTDNAQYVSGVVTFTKIDHSDIEAMASLVKQHFQNTTETN